MNNYYNRVKLGHIFNLNTKSITPTEFGNELFAHYSIPAYDEGKKPSLESGGNIRSNKYVLNRDSLLVSKLNPRINRVWKVVIQLCQPSAVCSTEFMVYQTENQDVSMDYYYHLFSSELFQEELLSLQSGTTGSRMRVTPKDTLNITVPLPSLFEQHKIAAILTSVDDAIVATQRIIGQTEVVKRGLMQQLLTKGIGHTTFKQTEIGEIPTDWDVVSLGDITNDSAFGPRFPADQYSDEGNYALLRTTDITDDWNIEYSTMPLADLPEDKFEVHRLRDGDLLVTRSGTCGVVCIFSEFHYPVIPGAFLIRFRLNDTVIPSFVRYAMMVPEGQNRIQLMAAGGVQKNLSGTNLRTLPLPLPSLEEQAQIVTILDSIQNKIEVERKHLGQLKSCKQGLMGVLLTGKVHVNVDELFEVSG